MQNNGFKFYGQLGATILFEKDNAIKHYSVYSRFEYYLIIDETPEERNERYK